MERNTGRQGGRSDVTDADDRSRGDAYAALTDETRVRILLELAAHYRNAWSEGWLSFSELRDRVGVEDAGRFSYHLGELQDEYVRKVGGEYRPQVAALEIAAAIRAGTYEGATTTADERRTDYACPHCDEALVLTYRNRLLYLGCDTHGAALAYPTPPRALQGRTLSAVVDLSLRKHAGDVALLRDGACPHCWGPAELTYPRGSVPDSYLLDDVPYATAACETCWLCYPLPVAHTVLGHPAVETLYAEHGLGPTAAQLGPHNLARTTGVDLRDEDSSGARLTVELDEGSLALDIDEDCSVVDHWRP